MDVSTAFDTFRALQAAWRAIKQAPVPLLVGGVLLAITSGGGGGGGPGFQGRFDASEADWEEIVPLMLPFLAVACCLGLVFFVVSSWLLVGFANSVEETLRTGRGDVGTLFDSRGRFADMLLARLFAALIQVGALLPFALAVGLLVFAADEGAIPEEVAVVVGIGLGLVGFVLGVYVALGFAFVSEAVALEGLAPGAALRRSWGFASGNRLRFLLYFVVLWIVTVLGICACCVGYLFTASLARVAAVESWLAVTPVSYTHLTLPTKA